MLIESLLSATFESSINALFFWVLAGLSVFAIFVAHGMVKVEKFASISPTLLTGIGILGTFLGIFLGLVKFNVNDIQGSIPALLEGMKIAFLSSIWGMLFGIIVRLAIIIFPIGFLANKDKDKKLSDSQHFLKLVEDISESSKTNAENFDKIITAITGDGDSTLATKLDKLRTDANDNHKDLKKEFQEFAEKVTENSSKAIVEALKDAIGKFNTTLEEQLGDNFKKFNEALGKLLEWQDNYKEQIKIMEEQFKRCTDSIVKVEKAMTSIKESTDAIPEAIEKLPNMLEKVNEDVDELQETLKAFASMKGQAMEAFPVLNDNLKKLTSGLEQQVNLFESTLEAQKENYQVLRNSFDGLGAQAESAIEQLNTEMKEAMKAQRGEIEKIAGQFSEQIRKEVNNIMVKIQDGTEESIKQSVKQLEGYFKEFDENMEVEITNAIQQMGRHLASLSEKFVSDYSPLTEQLQALLQWVEENATKPEQLEGPKEKKE